MPTNDPRSIKGKDVATQVAVDQLVQGQQGVRNQLAILRQTRGQRDVGALKIPAHLQQPLVLTDGGVQEKPTRAGGDE